MECGTRVSIVSFSDSSSDSSPLCGMILAALVTAIPTAAISSELPEEIWRMPGNDAVNSLYMFLRLNGYEEDYETFLAQAQSIRDDPTMTSLRNTSRTLGYSTEVVKATTQQVMQPGFPKPAVLFCERLGSATGKWNVLLYANEEHAAVLVGGTMVINLVPVDQFRLDWSGYALTTKIQQSLLGAILRYFSFAVAGLALLSLMLCRTARADCGH
jgi:hypothetical protein